MSANEQRRVVIELHPSHRATMEPVVEEVRAYLLRSVIEFGTGGSLGHTMELVISDEFVEVVRRYGSVGPEVQTLSQGLVPEVVERLRELGHEVEVRDCRTDSDRWRLRPDWKRRVEKAQWKVVGAVGEHRALRVVGFDDDTAADAIANVARAYPDARIAVAVPTNALLDRVRRRLGERRVNPLGLFTAKKKRPGRVSVGLVGQFPRQSGSEWDLLVLPYAEGTVSDAALRVIASGQFQRMLSFSRSKWTRDENINRRFLVIAGRTFPEERSRVSVTAVVLPAHGTRPGGVMQDAFQEKKRLYWHNGRRNRRVAEVARCIMKVKKRSVRAVVSDEKLVKEVAAAARSGVAVLVETPVHARELADLLPGWVIWTANGLDVAEPEEGCGIIVTERAATQYGIGAGVLIRATGTRWPLPEINWPSVRRVERAVLIDFADEFHPKAAKNATARTQSYQKAGMRVWAPEELPATEHHETTGASG